ncbi:hypothetical protein BJ741DRAFT_614277 [Chytriomyces cf. hyalinus JEL632]|nr:hypothetical protein BJ741DRAFT_614277 [Chytriomyces cf. hyalinus JEL632]
MVSTPRTPRLKLQSQSLLNLRRGTWANLLDTKTVGMFAGITLLFNNMTGSAIAQTPQIFQQCGGLVTSCAFIVFAVICTLCSLFIVEAMQAIPGNKHFQGIVEYATLVNFYFGPSSHVVAQFFLYGASVSQSVASIVMVSQAVDSLLLATVKATCGISLMNGPHAICVTADAVDGIFPPMRDFDVVLSFGYLLVFVFAVPLSFMDMKDNVKVQTATFMMTHLVFAGWIVHSIISGLNHSYVPVVSDSVGANLAGLIGISMLNFPFIQTVPTWVNLKQHIVNVQYTLWISTSLATTSYILIGLFVGSSFDFSLPGATIMSVLSHSVMGKVTGLMYSIFILGPSIPPFSIMAHGNLVQNFGFNSNYCKLFTHALPWLIATPVMRGQSVSSFNVWTSLLFVSVANFIIPFVIYMRACEFRGKYNHLRELSDNQLNLLKKIHCQSKSINAFIDNYPAIREHIIKTRLGTLGEGDASTQNDLPLAAELKEASIHLEEAVKTSSDTLNGQEQTEVIVQVIEDAASGRASVCNSVSASLPHIMLNSSQVLVSPPSHNHTTRENNFNVAFSSNSLAVPSIASVRSSLSHQEMMVSMTDVQASNNNRSSPHFASSIAKYSPSIENILATIDPQLLDDVPDPEYSNHLASDSEDFDDIMSDEECARVRSKLNKLYGVPQGTLRFGSRDDLSSGSVAQRQRSNNESLNINSGNSPSVSKRSPFSGFTGFGMGLMSTSNEVDRDRQSIPRRPSKQIPRSPKSRFDSLDRRIQSIPEIYETPNRLPRRHTSNSFDLTPRSLRSVNFKNDVAPPAANVSAPGIAVVEPIEVAVSPPSKSTPEIHDNSRQPGHVNRLGPPSVSFANLNEFQSHIRSTGRETNVSAPQTPMGHAKQAPHEANPRRYPSDLLRLKFLPDRVQSFFSQTRSNSLKELDHKQLEMSGTLQRSAESEMLGSPARQSNQSSKLSTPNRTLNLWPKNTFIDILFPPDEADKADEGMETVEQLGKDDDYPDSIRALSGGEDMFPGSSTDRVTLNISADQITAYGFGSSRKSIQLPVHPAFVCPAFQAIPAWVCFRGKTVAFLCAAVTSAAVVLGIVLQVQAVLLKP